MKSDPGDVGHFHEELNQRRHLPFYESLVDEAQ